MAKKLIANSWLTEPREDNQNTVGETLTQTEMASECDINFQIKRFQSLGISPFRAFDHSECKDLSDLSDNLIDANNTILLAREAFDELDDRVKQRFSGSPELFLKFMADLPGNAQEAYSLGLLKSPPVALDPMPSKTQPQAEPEAVKTPDKGSV